MARRHRIVIDVSAARVGGGVSRTRELAAALEAVAPEHDYWFAIGDAVADQIRGWRSDRLLLVPRALRSVPGRMLWQHTALPKLAEDLDADHLIGPFGTLPLARRPRGRIHVSIIVSNIGPFAPEITSTLRGYQAARNRMLRTLTLKSIGRADRVFVLSTAARDLLTEPLATKPVTVLPMSPPHPDLLRSANALELPASLEASSLFCAVGDLLPYKGFEDAILALGSLRASGTPASLVICGNRLDTNYANELEELARSEAPSAVRFLHGIGQVQVLALMQHAVGTIVSSRAENPGRVPVEAMAVGSPIVSADIPNARESCGDAALYYEPCDHRTLASHMAALLDDPDRRSVLASKGLGPDRDPGLDLGHQDPPRGPRTHRRACMNEGSSSSRERGRTS